MELKGGTVTEEEQIGLFADDIIVYLQNPDQSFPKLVQILKDFGKFSGYKLNITKTPILCINYRPAELIRQEYKLTWDSEQIKYLGVNLTKDFSTLYEVNYGKMK